jgi:hypothetical protein
MKKRLAAWLSGGFLVVSAVCLGSFILVMMSISNAVNSLRGEGKKGPAWALILIALWRPVRRSLRRHSGVLTFLGSMLVFGVFIFRDVIKEREKELAASVDFAESIFSVRVAQWNTNRRLAVLLRHGQAPPPGSSQSGAFVDYAETIVKAGRWELDDANEQIEACIELNASFPKEFRENRQQLADLERELEDLRRRKEVLLPKIALTVAAGLLRGGEGFVTVRKAEQTYEELVNEVVSLTETVVSTEKELLKLARSEVARHEKKVKRATHRSYFLYGAGFLLAFLAQLAGVKEIPHPE